MGVSPNRKQRLQGRWHPLWSLPRLRTSSLAPLSSTNSPGQTRGLGCVRAHIGLQTPGGATGCCAPAGRAPGSPPVQSLRGTRQRPARAAVVGWGVPNPWPGSTPARDGARLGWAARAGGGGARGSGAGGIGGLRSGVGGAAGGAAPGSALCAPPPSRPRLAPSRSLPPVPPPRPREKQLRERPRPAGPRRRGRPAPRGPRPWTRWPGC